MGQTVGTTVEPDVVIGTLSTIAKNLRATTDPAIKRTAANITYQLDDVAGLKPGTYMAYTYANLATGTTKNGWPKDAFGITTFQVGTETPEPKVAGNCTVCHDKTTSGTWKTAPSRLACLSCHDSDEAKAHGKLMTVLPTPGYDPYGPQAVETCDVCHGAGREFSPDKAHNISNPCKPPYPREAE